MIRVLDNFLINQIAAGEVIERPSSIIKELVENSIDAGSTAITVEVKSGGLSLIRVVDNGSGMDQQDAKMAFERHATSKISNASDLEQIVSLGFRGEALASIAAVSQVDLFTCQKGASIGTHVVNHGGAIVSLEGFGTPEGTCILVRNLFFNVPARLKFLKSVRSEAAAISDLMARLILSMPNISFKYVYDDKVIYLSSGNGDILSAIVTVYGNEVKGKLIPIDKQDMNGKIKAIGYVGNQTLTKLNRNAQTFFVNGRLVKNFLLSGCLSDSFRGSIPVNHFPFAVVYLNIPFDDIDVNVHPAKTQIRFKDERYIYQTLFRWFGDTLRERNAQNFLRTTAMSTLPADASIETMTDVSSYKEFKPSFGGQVAEGLKESVMGYAKVELNQTSIDDIPKFNILGIIFNTYIVVVGETELFLIDQHAAHERMLYEKFKDDLAFKKITTQLLLSPIIIELNKIEMYIFPNVLQPLLYIGFEIEVFDQSSLIVRGVPQLFIHMDIKTFISNVIDQYDTHKDLTLDFRLEAIIRLSCRKAVKANDKISDFEMNNLLEGILKNRIPLVCPHGRPIIISLSQHEIEAKFKRI